MGLRVSLAPQRVSPTPGGSLQARAHHPWGSSKGEGTVGPRLPYPWDLGLMASATAAAGATPNTPASQQAFPGQGPTYHCELRATASRTAGPAGAAAQAVPMSVHPSLHRRRLPHPGQQARCAAQARIPGWCTRTHSRTRSQGVKPTEPLASRSVLPACVPLAPSAPTFTDGAPQDGHTGKAETEAGTDRCRGRGAAPSARACAYSLKPARRSPERLQL